MAADALDDGPRPHDHARLGAAEQLVAGEADDVRAGLDGAARRGLVGEVGQVEQLARAEVVDQRHAPLGRELGQLAEPRRRREADDAEVRLVDAHDGGRLGADRGLVVAQRRPVGRPHLDQPRTRLGQDVGDAEGVADLDQLSAADDHLLAGGQGGQAQEHGGGVVVHGHAGLGARELGQQAAEVVVARSARAGGQVVLEVRIAGCDCPRPLERMPAGVGEQRVDRGQLT